MAVPDGEGGTNWYAAAFGGWDILDRAPVIENAELRGTTPVDSPLVKYVVTVVKPRQERWVIEVYTRHHIAHRIEQRLGVPIKHVEVILTGNRVRFVDAATGGRIAGLTATPVLDATEVARIKGETEPTP